MKVQVTESGTWRRTLEIEAPADVVDRRLQQAYKEYSKRMNMPGFRKGKIPVRLIKAQFGKAIQGEVLQGMMQEFYQEASQSEGLHPVSRATIEDFEFHEGQPLKFTASVDVKPEIALQNHKGLRITRPVFPVKDEHIDEQLQRLREQHATEQVVERPAALGDVVTADLQELDESGVPIVGRKQEGVPLHLGGSRAVNHDMANQVVGISAGEERQIRLTQPNEDGSEQEIRFQITAKEVRERNLPELDDELAKDVGDFDSLETLKTRIRESLQGQADYTSRRQVEENLISALIEENEIEIPESMVENYLDNIVESYKQEHAGHDHDIDEEAIRRESQDSALRGIKRYLLLEAVAEYEGIQATEEDIDKHLESLSERHNIEGPRLRQILGRSGQLSRIESELVEQKALDFLIEQAQIEDIEQVIDPDTQ